MPADHGTVTRTQCKCGFQGRAGDTLGDHLERELGYRVDITPVTTYSVKCSQCDLVKYPSHILNAEEAARLHERWHEQFPNNDGRTYRG